MTILYYAYIYICTTFDSHQVVNVAYDYDYDCDCNYDASVNYM